MRALTPRIDRCKQRYAVRHLPPPGAHHFLPTSTRMLTEKLPVVVSPVSAEKAAVLVVDDEYGPRESIAFSLAGEWGPM